MGTGTSHGVPVMACKCPVCTSTDKRDKRLRCSAWICGEQSIVIDTGPEFRIQALTHGIENIDAVFLTHAHADHLFGLDDLRTFSHTIAKDPQNPVSKETEGPGLSIYANPWSINVIKESFSYIFTPVKEGGGKPKLNLIDTTPNNADNPVKIKGLEIIPVPIMHGSLEVNGYLISQWHGSTKYSIAYLTDCSFVPQSSIKLILQKAGILQHVVIDALRERPHSTHFGFEGALEVLNQLKARHSWFTHITHNTSHIQIQQYIDTNLEKYPALMEIVKNGGSVSPAYDGLEITA